MRLKVYRGLYLFALFYAILILFTIIMIPASGWLESVVPESTFKAIEIPLAILLLAGPALITFALRRKGPVIRAIDRAVEYEADAPARRWAEWRAKQEADAREQDRRQKLKEQEEAARTERERAEIERRMLLEHEARKNVERELRKRREI